jgi:hypothetical protein
VTEAAVEARVTVANAVYVGVGNLFSHSFLLATDSVEREARARNPVVG